MVHRLIRDESGVVMGLAVIMIVLIGVMGAGLLVFVRNDLEAVVEVNQGQQALEMADAGIEAARNHLSTVDAKPASYDDDLTNGDSEWSDDGSPKQLDFDGDGNSEISVAIQYLAPSTTPDEASQPNNAPEVLPPDDGDPTTVRAYPNNRNYFRVTVQGRAGNALRQVQAIYRTENFDLPVAFYATRDINFTGNSSVTGISIFANRYIRGLRAGYISGRDQSYGNWAVDPINGNPNAYNRIARDGDAAGAAALGKSATDTTPTPAGASESGIDYDPDGGSAGNTNQKNRTATPQRYGVLDFDRDSDLAPVSSRDFEQNTWGALANQPSDTITFPFRTGDVGADADLISSLKQRAQTQGNYIRKPSGSSFTIDDGLGPDNYPRDSNLETVYFVVFAEGTDDSPVYGARGTATYKANTTDTDNKVKGTIVVVNGILNFTDNSADDFQGAVIVRDPNDTDNSVESNVMKFNKSGEIQLEGFASVEGDISLAGTVDGILPGALVNGIPGLFKVSLWSWRECYNTTCS
jgi:hypothetical protein